MTRKLLSFFIFLSLTPAIFAQTIIVTGRVTDKETNEGIPFANLTFKGANNRLSTDFDGYFTLEIKKTSDSLVASCVGYQSSALRIRRTSQTQKLNFELSRAVYTKKQQAAINRSESRALDIMHRVILLKKSHNRQKLSSYRYEAYTKIQVELDELNSRFQNQKIFKPFKFVFNDIDSFSQMQPFLPFFLTETVSDFHYQRSPVPSLREIIKASKVSGVNDVNVSQFLGNTYTNVNVYNDFIEILSRQFVSPASSPGLNNYTYYLVDSQYINHFKCYKIRFIPKQRRRQLLLQGDMWIADSVYAIKQISMSMRPGDDINLVKSLSLYNEFIPVKDSVWMLKREQISIHFIKPDKTPGLVARKTASYKNFVINERQSVLDSLFKNNSNDVTVGDSASFRSEAYWDNIRHDTLSVSEQQVYDMIDTLSNMRVIKNYINLFQTLAIGYTDFGPIAIGDVRTFVGEDNNEGWRIKFGMRTNAVFSKYCRLGGYVAYGFSDKRVKYGLNFSTLIKKDPRRMLTASYYDDLTTSTNLNIYNGLPDLVSTYGLRRVEDGQYIPLKAISTHEFKLAYAHEFKFGYTITPGFLNRSLRPLTPFNFSYLTDANALNPNTVITSATVSEISITQRFAWQERFLCGDYWRTSLGSKFPILTLQYAFGIRRLMGGMFNYQRLNFTINDTRLLGLYGKLRWNVDVGKYFGDLPFILLQTPDASETYVNSWTSFNTIHRYEFVADRYVKVFLEHHLEGLLFAQIPGFKKLKLREVYGMRMWWGDLTSANYTGNYANMLANSADNGLVQLQLADKVPLVEVNAGVENILHFFRIDAVWRVTHLDPRGNRFSFRYGNFGLRIAFQIQF
jgi:hypothetical protein